MSGRRSPVEHGPLSGATGAGVPLFGGDKTLIDGLGDFLLLDAFEVVEIATCHATSSALEGPDDDGEAVAGEGRGNETYEEGGLLRMAW